MSSSGQRLREAADAGCVVAPGSHDCVSAQLVQAAGLPATYIGGLALQATDFGKPNVGYATLTEYVEHARRVTRAVDIPVIVDGETGFGSEIDIRRAVTEFADAGVAAIHVEDQARPWTSYASVKAELLPAEEMALKLQSAREALGDSDFVLIARTDAGFESVEAAIERCNLYLDAGADMAMPMMSAFLPYTGATTSYEERLEILRRFVREIHGPVVTHTPTGADLDVADAEAAGMSVYVMPLFTLGPALAGVRSALDALTEGHVADYVEGNPPFSTGDLARITSMAEYAELGKRYALSG